MKRNNKRKMILVSLVSVLVCGALLAASSFAWFTDNVENKDNTIDAGKLEIAVVDENGKTLDMTTEKFIEVSNIEPGWSDEATLNIKNVGTLAADVSVTLIINSSTTGATGATGADLLDAMWYSLDGGRTKIAISGFKEFEIPEVQILAGETITDAIKFTYGMYESAGNEYQNKSLSIDLIILAKQSVHEEDGFGSDQYDKDATYPLTVRDNLGKSLSSDVIANSCYVNDENPGTFNGNGNTITLLDKASLILYSNQKIKDLIIDGESNVGNMIKMHNSADVVIENVDFVNFKHQAVFVMGNSTITFKNCTFSMPKGYKPENAGNYFVQAIADSKVAFENCTFNGNTGGLKVRAINAISSVSPTFTDCTFNNCIE